MIVKFTGEYIKQKVKVGKKNKVIFVEESIFQQIGTFTMSETIFYSLFGEYDSNSGNPYINELNDYILSNVEIPYNSVVQFLKDVKKMGEKLCDRRRFINEFSQFVLFIEEGYQQIENSGTNSQKVVLEFIGDS